jgi:hypothetical protein
MGGHCDAEIGDRGHVGRFEIEFEIRLSRYDRLTDQIERRPLETTSFINPDFGRNSHAFLEGGVEFSHQYQPVLVAALQPELAEERHHVVADSLHTAGLGGEFVQDVAAAVENEVHRFQLWADAEIDVLALKRALQPLQSSQ